MMGILNKLAFWKKKDDLGDIGKDLDFDKDLGLGNEGPSPDLGTGLDTGMQQQPFQKYPSFQQTSFQQQPFQQPGFQQPSSNDNYIAAKNLEVISSKIDA